MPDAMQIPLKPLDDIYSHAGLQIQRDRLCSELEEGWISPSVSHRCFHGGDCYIPGMQDVILTSCLSLYSKRIISLKSVRYGILAAKYSCLPSVSRGQEVSKHWYSMYESESQILERALVSMGVISGGG